MSAMAQTVVRVLVGGAVGARAHLTGAGVLLLKGTAQVPWIITARFLGITAARLLRITVAQVLWTMAMVMRTVVHQEEAGLLENLASSCCDSQMMHCTVVVVTLYFCWIR
jgi:hypothetical protein